MWPFETGFGLPPKKSDARIVHAEIYPSLRQARPIYGECKDAAQVRTLATHFADLDDHGELARLFGEPANLNSEQRVHVLAEEGWILGVQ